jgi:hypothetical protein
MFKDMTLRLIVGDSIDQARKRTKVACIAGYVWTLLSFVSVTSWIFLPVSEDTLGQRLSLGLYVGLVCEVGIVAFLSYGIMRRKPKMATALFFYFWVSRLFWLSTGLISFDGVPNIVRFIVLHLVPVYLFYQGMRGAWTHHRLTNRYKNWDANAL